MDAYVTASSLAFSIFVLVDDIVAPVFVQIYIRTRKQAGDLAANVFFWKVLVGVAITILAMVIIMEIGAQRLMDVVAPGFDSEQRANTIRLLRWTLPGGLFLGLAALTYVILNSRGEFAWPEIARVAYKGT